MCVCVCVRFRVFPFYYGEIFCPLSEKLAAKILKDIIGRDYLVSLGANRCTMLSPPYQHKS